MIEPMTKERREAYVEVIEVLNHMDSKYTKKIPEKLLNFFIYQSSKEYKYKLKKNVPLEEQELKDTTINILAMLNLNYWCESEERKKELLKKYYDNEMKYQEMLMDKYNTDNLFKKTKRNNHVYKKEEFNNLPEEYEEPEWYVLLFEEIYERVARFIRRLFS